MINWLTQPEYEKMFAEWKKLSGTNYDMLIGKNGYGGLGIVELIENRMQRAFEAGVVFGANWHRDKIIEYFSGELP